MGWMEATAHAAVVAAVAGGLFLNTLEGEFVFDDRPAIVSNHDCHPDKNPLMQAWKNNFWGQEMGSPYSQHASYRPLTIWTFRANVWAHGLEPYGFHVVNAVLHAVASVMFYFVCRWVHGKDTPGIVSFFAAIMFAAHPVHSEAVANIVGRAEVLSCICFFAALLSYFAACEYTSFALVPSVVFTAAAVLCKEQGIMVVGVCLVYDIWVKSEFDLLPFVWGSLDEESLPDETPGLADESHDAQETKKEQKAAAAAAWVDPTPRMCVFIFCAVSIVEARLAVNGSEEYVVDEKTNPATHIQDPYFRILTKSYYVVLHLWVLLFPFDLCCDWSSFGIPNIESFQDIRIGAVAMLFVVAMCIVVAVTDDALLPRKFRAKIAFGVALAAFPFLPASGLFLDVGFVVAERVLYVPSAGTCFLLSAVLWHKWQQCPTPPAHAHELGRWTVRNVLLLFAAGVLASHGLKLWNRNAEWKSEAALYESGVRYLPNNAKLHHNYARSIADNPPRDVWHKIEFHYREAIRIYPPYASAYINLGVHLAQTNPNRLEEAVKIWTEGLAQWKRNPILGDDPLVLGLNIGMGYKNMGKPDEAIPFLEECLQRAPGYARCRQVREEIRASFHK